MSIADLALKTPVPIDLKDHESACRLIIGSASDERFSVSPMDFLISYLKSEKFPQNKPQIMRNLEWSSQLFYNTVARAVRQKKIIKIGLAKNKFFCLADYKK